MQITKELYIAIVQLQKHGWGGTSKEAGALDSFMFEWATDSILDFGCGKGALGKNVLRRL